MIGNEDKTYLKKNKIYLNTGYGRKGGIIVKKLKKKKVSRGNHLAF